MYHRYLQLFTLELLLRCLQFFCYTGRCSSQVTYKISPRASDKITKQLFYLGVSASTIFPDLDNLSRDLNYEVSS